jgi:hypothetical protein
VELNKLWSAPAEQSGDGALDLSELDTPKRRRAALAAALQIRNQL